MFLISAELQPIAKQPWLPNTCNSLKALEFTHNYSTPFGENML